MVVRHTKSNLKSMSKKQLIEAVMWWEKVVENPEKVVENQEKEMVRARDAYEERTKVLNDTLERGMELSREIDNLKKILDTEREMHNHTKNALEMVKEQVLKTKADSYDVIMPLLIKHWCI